MRRLLEDKEIIFLNQIFAKLYEDDNYERAFSTFLENLKDLIKFQKGDIYFYHDEKRHIVFDDFIFADWEEASLSSYMNNYADIDDALPIVGMNQPVMFRSSDVFLQDERMKTKYYNELLLPEGMHFSIEGNIYNDGDGCIAGIGIHRPNELGDFTERDLEIMKLSRLHLVNVAKKLIQNRQEFDCRPVEMSLLQDIKELGICIFDHRFNVVDSNLNKNNFIRHEHLEELMRSLITLCKSMIKRIDASDTKAKALEDKGHIRITIGNTSYYVEVIYRQAENEHGTFVAVIYNRSDLFDKLAHEVCQRYGLTERECEVLKYAMRGVSNAEIGKELFISIPTVKKHLTNIYTKMGIDGKHQVFGAIMR